MASVGPPLLQGGIDAMVQTIVQVRLAAMDQTPAALSLSVLIPARPVRLSVILSLLLRRARLDTIALQMASSLSGAWPTEALTSSHEIPREIDHL